MSSKTSKLNDTEKEPINPGGFIYAEFLYWQPIGLDLHYATTGVFVGAIFTKKHFVKYDFHPGFKVGAGYRSPTKWDIIGNFTYIKPDGSDSVVAPTGELIHSAFDKSLTFGFYQAASSHVELDYKIGDLDVGRRKFIWPNFVMRFILGIKGVWIEQDWDNTFSVPSSSPATAPTTAKNKWNVAGGGGKLGVNLKWISKVGLGVFGKTSFALLIVREKFLYRQNEPVSGNRINIRLKENKLVPTVDFELGLFWERFFHNDRWGMNLGISYQITNWWHLNQMLRQGNFFTFDENEAGNLDLQGLTVHAGIYF